MKGFFRFGSPMIKLPIRGKIIEMLLDTGFNGHIMLPQNIIDELKLEKIGVSDYVTASGEKRLTYVHKGEIEFFDEEIEVPVLSTNANFSLAGMELFHQCKVTIERHKDVVELNKSI